MAQRALPTFDELYRQIERLPEGVTGEILDPGAIRTMSRPGSGHRHAGKGLTRTLGDIDAADGGKGWWVEIEAEIRFPLDRLCVPDLAGWRVERVPQMPRENPIRILPDWVCEVLSPTTMQVDRHKKLPLYIAAGIAHVWLVDPDARLIEVFTPSEGAPKLVASAAEAEVVALPPFGLEMAIERFWLPRTEAPTA